MQLADCLMPQLFQHLITAVRCSWAQPFWMARHTRCVAHIPCHFAQGDLIAWKNLKELSITNYTQNKFHYSEQERE